MSINVQVRSARNEIPLCGHVVKLCPTHITMNLPELPANRDVLACGIEIELTIASPAGSYMTLAQIEAVNEEILVAALFTHFSYEQRRRHRRISCAWPAMLRRINSDGTVGSWKPARVVDISEGGAAVVIDAQAPSDHWELRLELQQGATARQYDDSGFNGASVPKQLIMQVRASMRHNKICPEGLQLGLAFTQTTPRVSTMISHMLELIERNAL